MKTSFFQLIGKNETIIGGVGKTTALESLQQAGLTSETVWLIPLREAYREVRSEDKWICLDQENHPLLAYIRKKYEANITGWNLLSKSIIILVKKEDLSMGKEKTGYPSIDKPWLKYYRDEIINADLPTCTIYEYLYENNKDTLDNIAINYFDRKITYCELLNNIERCAKALASIGIKKSDVVTIFSTNTPETIYLIYALNYIGAIVDLEYVTISEKEAVKNVSTAKSKAVFVLDLLIPKFHSILQCQCVESVISLPLSASMPALKRTLYNLKTKKTNHDGIIAFSEFACKGQSVSIKKHSHIPNEPAVIVRSGGTTGTPKGVILSNENLNSIAWQYANFDADYQRRDTFMHSIPPFHAFGLGVGINMPLCIGFQLILTVKFDEKSLVELFLRHKPIHFVGGASHINAIIKDSRVDKMDLSHLKTFALGGSALTETQEIFSNEFLDAHHSVCKTCMGYGMSEVSATICTEMNRFYGKVGSVGIPFCKANCKVIDVDSSEELQYNQIGELCFSTPGLMLGYFENEEETRNAIFTDDEHNRWVHTGDIGYVDQDGFVFITGRIKRIYTTQSEKNGTLFKLFPDYVAKVISQNSVVKECAVVCIENPDYKHIAIAFVSLNGNADWHKTKMEIEQHCRNELATYNIPKQFYLVDEIPHTALGKIDYQQLEKLAKMDDC